MEQGKVCSKCGEWKPFGEFHKNKQSKDGLRPNCKECASASGKSHYKKNSESIKERTNKRYYENIDQIKEKSKKYREENAEELRVRAREYYYENKEELNQKNKKRYRENIEYYEEYRKKHYEVNSEYYKEYRTKYYQENKEKVNQLNNDWYEKNKESIREKRREYGKKYTQTEKGREKSYRARLKRRSYKHKVVFTPHERIRLLDRDKWECQCCGIKVHDRSTGDWNTPDKAHIDHITPISKGGDSSPDNLQVLCRTCNTSKSNKVV